MLGQSQKALRAQPTLQMETSECGAACLAMILGAHKRYVTLEEVRTQCRVGRDGANAPSILRAAAFYGLAAKALRREPETLKDLPLPAILHWGFDHFVVLNSIRPRTFEVLDPASGRLSVDLGEMNRMFTGVALAFVPDNNFAPSGQRPSTIRALANLSKGSWDALALVFLIGTISTIPGLIVSGAVSTFATYLIDNDRPVWLLSIFGTLLLVTTILFGLAWFRARIVAVLRAKISIMVSARMFEHALFLPLRFFSQRDPGELVARLRVGSEIGSTISGPLAQLAPTIVTAAVFVAVMALYDPVTGLAIAAVATINLLILVRLITNVAEAAKLTNVLKGKAFSAASSGFSAFDALQLLGREDLLRRRWLNAEENALNAEQRFGVQRILATLGPSASEMLMAIIVLGVGAVRTLTGDLPLSDLLALLVLAGFAASPLTEAANQFVALQNAAGAIHRLNDVTNHPRDPLARLSVKTAVTEHKKLCRPGLFLDRVSYSYEASATLFSDVSMHIAPGTLAALTGHSGTGKSTLARICAGMLSPTAGEVYIDDHLLSGLAHDDLRRRLQYCPQQIAIFTGTCRDNISLFNDGIEDEAIWWALNLTNSSGFVSNAGGLDLLMTRENPRFSGGELQRLSLARALARKPDILLLDEVTSALDNETERQVLEGLRSYGGAAIIATHRRGTVARCDCVFDIRGGLVREVAPILDVVL